MKIYAIGGLGADERVFKNLKLNCPVHTIQWVEPCTQDTLESYALRLVAQLDLKEEFMVIGVSFGGMLAIALQKYLHPKRTILISSARNKYDLPLLYRFLGKLKILKLIPPAWMKLPKGIAACLFDAEQKDLLFDIIKDTDLHFLKWALIAITNWDEDQTFNCISIHGTRDKLIPFPQGKEVIPIKDAGHFMIVDRAEEVSKMINEIINNPSN